MYVNTYSVNINGFLTAVNVYRVACPQLDICTLCLQGTHVLNVKLYGAHVPSSPWHFHVSAVTSDRSSQDSSIGAEGDKCSTRAARKQGVVGQKRTLNKQFLKVRVRVRTAAH